jgi:hypothetical protein
VALEIYLSPSFRDQTFAEMSHFFLVLGILSTARILICVIRTLFAEKYKVITVSFSRVSHEYGDRVLHYVSLISNFEDFELKTAAYLKISAYVIRCLY